MCVHYSTLSIVRTPRRVFLLREPSVSSYLCTLYILVNGCAHFSRAVFRFGSALNGIPTERARLYTRLLSILFEPNGRFLDVVARPLCVSTLNFYVDITLGARWKKRSGPQFSAQECPEPRIPIGSDEHETATRERAAMDRPFNPCTALSTVSAERQRLDLF